MSFQFTVTGSSDKIVAAEGDLQARLEDADLPNMVIARAVLALEEVVLNACRHGGAPEVTVHVELGDRGCRLVFEDSGVPFDPLAGQFAEPPPVSMDVVGGRGLMLIRRSATRAHYEHAAGRNRLVLDFDG